MEATSSSSKSKHKRSHDKDRDSHTRKRAKHKHHSKKSSKKNEDHIHVVDDDVDDEDMWVEKNVDMDGEKMLMTDIPTAESLKLTSQAPAPVTGLPSLATETPIKRDDWMLEGTSRDDDLDSSADFFSTLGGETRKKKQPPPPPDPDTMKISSKELNTQLKDGKSLDEYAVPAPTKIVPGGPGSQWRMMRLRRVYETSEEEGKPVEEVAIDRFGSLEAFEEAKVERRILDEREGARTEEKPRGRPKEPNKKFYFTDIGSTGSSRSSSFRRPVLAGDNGPPTPPTSNLGPNRRPDSSKIGSQRGTPQATTPIPSVLTPSVLPQKTASRGLSPSSLNRLQAKVLKAKLMGSPDAAALEKEYEEVLKKANEGPRIITKVEVLPTLDGHGRLYDVGTGKGRDAPLPPGNRRKKEKVETRDPKTGEIVRYNADDDTTTLGEMLRQEKFGAGSSDQKDFDGQLAKAIMGDGKFENDLEYMDDNAEKLGRRKMRTDAMKRQFAINDYKRTQKVLATCPFCFGEDDSPPKVPMVALGSRVYLSCTTHERLVDDHCLIVPIQHHLTMLEGDDDVWDEVRNFMKCLMRMFAEEDKGVIFYETVLTLKYQNHTFIECVPVPWAEFEVLPGYFRQSILTSETEWSQHKKLIDFSARPGGFRRSMVPNLPYFMVQFDYKGEKGYGHVIEGTNAAEETEEGMDEGEKGGGDFPRYFAGEIIGNLLELEPRKWRRPRKVDWREQKAVADNFKKKYSPFDWTNLISSAG